MYTYLFEHDVIWGRSHFCVSPNGMCRYSYASEQEAKAHVDWMNDAGPCPV